jgi:dihydrofolate reductase
MSLDGYSSAPNQSLENPFGEGGFTIMDWALATRTFRTMFGTEGGSTGLDDSFAANADVGVGATIMGRNMFSPTRGPWLNEEWKGWWGPNPPYHHPVFVLTNHPRASFPMEGGTSFHFVTEGIETALEKAFDAAQGKDVRIGGGGSVVRQYLRAGLIDELHLVITPKLLGAGVRVFEGVEDAVKLYECAEFKASDAALHVRLVKRR